MAETTPGYVQVADDGTGKKVRNLVVTQVVDGVEQTLHMQVVALSDEEGRPLLNDVEWRQAMLEQAVETTDLLRRIWLELA